MSTLRGASGDQKGWSRQLDDPIATADGGVLWTLRDARVYILAPPPAEAERRGAPLRTIRFCQGRFFCYSNQFRAVRRGAPCQEQRRRGACMFGDVALLGCEASALLV
jgi:hypothetical protein